jgi:hypothetical protein
LHDLFSREEGRSDIDARAPRWLSTGSAFLTTAIIGRPQRARGGREKFDRIADID